MKTWKIRVALLAALVLMGMASYAQVQTQSATSTVHGQVQTPSQTASPPAVTPSASVPMIVVFYEEGCPDCVIMEGLLDELLVGHEEDVAVARYEINSPGSTALMWELSAHYGIVATTVPLIFIGDQAIVGAGRAQEFNLRTAVGDCIQRGCPSPLDYVEGGKAVLHDLLIAGAFVGLFLILLVLQSM
ncbi:MAG TPA: hypothetical protein ENL23_06285 [Candidatus Acetothermia bacterium]|nr:hypothetical protein [Candidatus Acetothermia bacterium]